MGLMLARLFYRYSPIINDKLQSTFQHIKDRFSRTTDQVQQFSQTNIGKQVALSSKRWAVHTSGVWLGSTYPQGAIVFSLTQNAADRIIHRLDSEQTYGKQKRAFLSLTIAALCTCAFGAVSFMTASAVMNEDSSSSFYSGALCYYTISVIGATLGGMQALRIGGFDLHEAKAPLLDSYPARISRSLVSRDIIQLARNVIPIPFFLTPFSGVVGCAIKATIGITAFHADILTPLAIQAFTSSSSSQPSFDPVELGKILVNFSFKTTTTQSRMGWMLQTALQTALDQKWLTHAVVRSLNQYVDLLKDPEIKKALQDFDRHSVASQEELIRIILQKICVDCTTMEKGIIALLQKGSHGSIHSLAEKLQTKIVEKEDELIGYPILDRASSQQLCEVHARGYLILTSLTAFRMMRVKNVADLTEKETKDFYVNSNELVCEIYLSQSKMVKPFRKIVSFALPYLLNKPAEKLLMGILDEKLKESEALQSFPETANAQNKSLSVLKRQFLFFSFLVSIIRQRIRTSWLRIVNGFNAFLNKSSFRR